MKNIFLKFLIFWMALGACFFLVSQAFSATSSIDVSVQVVGTSTEPENPPGGGPTNPPIVPDPLAISNLSTSTLSYSSTTIVWNTNNSALCTISWGLDQTYGFDNIVETQNYTSHSHVFLNLQEQKTYHLKISCTDTNGSSAQTSDYFFTTLKAPDLQPPANVINFEAIPGIRKITLRWQNPTDPDLSRIKILRSTNGYPASPSQGFLIYDADGIIGEHDDNNLTPGVRYYYTAFAFDLSGNYSSGALANGVPLPPEGEEIIIPELPGGFGQTTTLPILPPEELPLLPEDEKLKDLRLQDFNFFQGLENVGDGKAFKIEAGKPLEISIGCEQIPESVKNMIIVLERDGKRFSFFLRKSHDCKFKSEIIIPSDKRGSYKVTVFFVDWQNNVIKRLSGEIQVLNYGFLRLKFSKNWQQEILLILAYMIRTWWIDLLILLLIILIILYLSRRKKEKIEKVYSQRRSVIEDK